MTCLHYLLSALIRRYHQRRPAEVFERIIEAIKYLLDAGADPKLGFHDLLSPLESAVQYRSANGDWHAGDAFGEAVRIMSEHSDS